MFRSITRAALLVAASFSFGAHGAAAEDIRAPIELNITPPTTVYDTSLAPGWDNWSWAKTQLSTELSGSARRPIKVEAEGWQALYLHHAGFDTTGLKRLSFLIQGSVPDREVRVYLVQGGKPVGEGKLVKLGNAGWTDVKVPLVTLGVENQVIDGIWVQNASAEALPKFYVTDIKLD